LVDLQGKVSFAIKNNSMILKRDSAQFFLRSFEKRMVVPRKMRAVGSVGKKAVGDPSLPEKRRKEGAAAAGGKRG